MDERIDANESDRIVGACFAAHREKDFVSFVGDS